jgi:hypothetical protein
VKVSERDELGSGVSQEQRCEERTRKRRLDCRPRGVRNVVENRYLSMNAWHQALAVDDERRLGYCIYKGMMTMVNERRREVILCVDSHSVGQSDGCDFWGWKCVRAWVCVGWVCEIYYCRSV